MEASLVTQTVKNLPAMQIWVQSLGWEDALEADMATHSNILAWRNSMDRGVWWATVHGIAESDMAEWLSTKLSKCSMETSWARKYFILIYTSKLLTWRNCWSIHWYRCCIVISSMSQWNTILLKGEIFLMIIAVFMHTPLYQQSYHIYDIMQLFPFWK